MNNIFDLKRFANYACMNYWYNKRSYFGLMLGIVVMLILLLCQFNLFTSVLTYKGVGSSNFSNHIIDRFTVVFYSTLGLFIMMVIKTSMKGINAKCLILQDILIPVSTFERYIFTILNSTIVATVVYIALYQLVSNYIETLYLFSDNAYMFKGFFGCSEEKLPSFNCIQECHMSLRDIVCNGFIDSNIPRDVSINTITVIYLLFVSMFMWGEITFQNMSSQVLTILVHLAIIAATIALFAFSDNNVGYPTGNLRVSYDISSFAEENVIYLIYASYILPITYQWVVWKKLKTISLTK